jgi:hypothetical protein
VNECKPLMNGTSTCIVEPGCDASVTDYGDLKIDVDLSRSGGGPGDGGAAACTCPPMGRGLHSSTFQLNLSRF